MTAWTTVGVVAALATLFLALAAWAAQDAASVRAQAVAPSSVAPKATDRIL